MTNQFREHCLREMRSLTQGRMRERREAKLGSGLTLTTYTRAPPSSKDGIKMQPTTYAASTCIVLKLLMSKSYYILSGKYLCVTDGFTRLSAP